MTQASPITGSGTVREAARQKVINAGEVLMGKRTQRIEIVWLNRPSDEAILRAQLLLLGWTPEEIRRARAAEAARKQAQEAQEADTAAVR